MKKNIQYPSHSELKNHKEGIFPYFACLILFCCLWSSCDSFVEVDLPNNQLTSVTIFENKTTANAALANIYAQIRDNGLLTGKSSGISLLLGNYTDELTFYGANGNLAQDFFNNSLLPSNTNVLGLWNNSYKQIYATNALMAGVENSTALLEQEKKQFLGEAYFIRALIHFYLTNLYDEIPYVTGTDYQVNQLAPKISADLVYQNVIEDLKKAVAFLPANYVSAGRVRPNIATAKALLARVYLYKNMWTEAEATASEVIQNTALYTLETIDKEFLKESTSAIWQFMPSTAGRNTEEGSSFVFLAGPPSLTALSSDLMAAFTSDDQRKVQWTKSITSGATSWYHANKYKQRLATGTSVEYSILFRLAEQYLIRAEARARLNNLPGAKDDLNKIRNRAGLQNTMEANTIEAIMKERRLELFTELGHRFFDLKRTGGLDALSALKPGWNATDKNFPIPEVELRLNPKLLPQNQGY